MARVWLIVCLLSFAVFLLVWGLRFDFAHATDWVLWLGIVAVVVATYFGAVPQVRHAGVVALKPKHVDEGAKSRIVYAAIGIAPPPRLWWWSGKDDAERLRSYVSVEQESIGWPAYWIEDCPPLSVLATKRQDDKFRVADIAWGETWYVPIVQRVNAAGTNNTDTYSAGGVGIGGEGTRIVRLDVRPASRGGTWFYVLWARDSQPAHLQAVGPFSRIDEAMEEARQSNNPWDRGITP